MKKSIIITLSIMFLILSSLQFIMHFDSQLLSDSFKQDAGASSSLPPMILSLNALITREKIQKFRLEGALNDDPLLYQRAIEYTYPARLDPGAKDVFVIKGTPLNSNCVIINHQDSVAHYVCE